MDQAIVIMGNNPGTPLDAPAKRKRGRPRKDADMPRVKNVQVPRPPGFSIVYGSRPIQQVAFGNPRDEMIGQPVSGVVEATFDAGYLLNVRFGNSNVMLRGVVFKPGRYVPVSSQNDIAPNVPMIRRQDVPLPRRNKIQVHRNKYRSREKIEQNGTFDLSNESTPVNRLFTVSNQVVSPLGSRGNAVPVLLQPINLSNGIHAATPAPHLALSKFKQPPILAIQAPPLINKVGHHQNQMNHQKASMGRQNEGEVMKRKSASQSGDVLSENISGSGNVSAEDVGLTKEIRVSNMSEPLLIKPLQAFQTDFHEQVVPICRPMGNGKVDKMMELLQVVQENMMESQQQHQDQHKETSSFHEVGSSESKDDILHSNQHSQASSFL